MSIKEHDIPAIQEMLQYFSGVGETVDSLSFQFEKFATPEKAYVLNGDINRYKSDLKRITALLNRIKSDLIKDGVCIIEPVDLQNGNKRTSIKKQDSRSKRR